MDSVYVGNRRLEKVRLGLVVLRRGETGRLYSLASISESSLAVD